jgi:hypothetical protein
MVSPTAGHRLVPTRPLLVRPVVARFDLAPGDRALVGVGARHRRHAGRRAPARRPARRNAGAARRGHRRPGDRLTGDSAPSRSLRRAAAAAAACSGPAAAGRSRDRRDGDRSRRRWPASSARSGQGPDKPSNSWGRSARRLRARGPDPWPTRCNRGGRRASCDRPGCRTGRDHPRRRSQGRRGEPDPGRAMGSAGSSWRRCRARTSATSARQSADARRCTIPPFAVLVLDGVVRHPIAAAVMAVLGASPMRGQDRHRSPDAGHPRRPSSGRDAASDRVGCSTAPCRAGGRWIGRSVPPVPAGVHLEAGLVVFDDGMIGPVPLADLERST